MDVSAVVAEYGAYYLSNGQNTASLYQVARRQFVSESAFTSIITDDTTWRAGKSTFDRVVQPFQKLFTPIAQVKFEPITINSYHLKADTQEYPDDLEATWLGFMADHNLKRTEWPFIRWFLESHYFPQIQQDMEMNEFGKGVFGVPSTGVAGAAGTSMNGFLTVISSQITAGRIAPIVMGNIPTSDADFVKYLESFADQINKTYWNAPLTLNMSETLERKYQRGKRDLYGKNFVGTELNTKIDYTNITIQSLPSMNGSSRIWTTPKANGIVLKKKTENTKLVDIQGLDRLVKMLSDWYYGVGFILPEIVWCNDKA